MEKQIDFIDVASGQQVDAVGGAVYMPPTQTPAIIASNETSQILSIIERVALSPDADISKLEKMIDLQERILNKNAHAAFSAAFAEMQTELPEIVENSAIKHDKKLISKYANFEDINAGVKPIIAKHGFGISFRIDQSDGKIKVTGILSHRGGHSESTDMVLPADTSGSKNAVQSIGSSVSYAKRYVLQALLNISTRGEDDDGQKAGDKGLGEFQKESLKSILMDCDAKAKEWFANTYGCIDDVPVRMFTVVETRLKNARDAAKKGEVTNGTN